MVAKKRNVAKIILRVLLIIIGLYIVLTSSITLLLSDDTFYKLISGILLSLVLIIFYKRHAIGELTKGSFIPSTTVLKRMSVGLKILIVPLVGLAYILFDLSKFRREHETQGFFVVLLLIIDIALLFIVAATLRRRKKQEDEFEEQLREAQYEDYGSAKWATIDEFLQINRPDSSIGKGLWLGAGFLRTKPGHLFTVAPPGQGKGTCLIIPNLLIQPVGSYVVTDPKGENACITARAQKEAWNQKVYILDPWDEQKQIGATHGIPSSGFNPFDFIKDDKEELPDNCEMIAHYLVPHNPQAKDQFWDDRARSLIKLVMIHILTTCQAEEQNFWTLYKYLRTDEKGLADLILDMKENTAYDGLVSSGANELMGLLNTSSTFGGIMSNAQNATKLFESPKLRKALDHTDFNPAELSVGNCTVYVVIPERYMQSHSAWLKIVIGLCLKAVNARPNKRVVFMLDEFAILGKLDDAQRAYAFGRGQNIVMWTFMQSLAQMRQIYGEDGMNQFINNALVFQAFGLQDQFSKEYVSKMLGTTTRVKNTNSTSSGQSGESNSSGRESYDFPLMTPDEVGNEKDIITIAEGVKFLVKRQPYFKNIFEGISINDPGLSKEQKDALKNGQKLEDEWYKIFKTLADKPPRVYS